MKLLYQLYLVFTISLFGFSMMALQREITRRSDFHPVSLWGTYNLYRYFRHVKKAGESLSLHFKICILAHVNFLLYLTILGIIAVVLITRR